MMADAQGKGGPRGADAPDAGEAHSRWWLIAAVVVGLCWLFWFARGFITSGFQLLHGDPGDARFTALVTSHWANPMQFAGGWTDLGFFHPAPHTLGFSDTMLAFGILAAPFQGLGYLQAMQLAIIVLQAIGYASLIAFLRIGPRCPWPIAIAAAALWNFSNAMFVGSPHPQLISFSIIPAVLLGALVTVRAHRMGWRIVLGVATGLLMGIVVTTAFYVGWFTLFAAVIVLLLWLILSALCRRLAIRWQPALIGAVSMLVGGLLMAPVFIAVYAPVFQPSNERTIDLVLGFLLRKPELINVTAGNLVWGGPLTAIFGDSLRGGEMMMAPTIGLLLVSAIALVIGLIRIRRLTAWSLLGIAILATGFVMWIAPVDLGPVQPWRWIYEVPGASAIRAVGRIHILAASLLALGTALLATQWWRSTPKARAGHAIAVVIAVFLMLEQVNTGMPQANSAQRAAALDAVPRPTAACTSFVLVPPFDPDVPTFVNDIDAMWISRHLGLPTWNGYSGLTPANYSLDTGSDEYLRQVRGWKTINRLRDACGYHLQDGTWLSPAELGMLIDRSVGWG